MTKAHGVKRYHGVLQGSLQAVGPVNPELIVEFGGFENAKRARLEVGEDVSGRNEGGDEEKDAEEGNGQEEMIKLRGFYPVRAQENIIRQM
ncbi:hypothetical protein PC113_g5379 [Phytophthora cactorum]|uniref:Uncharacterized protein n=1 Tax=Phytophthora cactorum TaxID=29920 RepID=A0A8T0ZNE7_9STRA|nr:hypothetical protein PC113_g5379 [Phytophthora cactorum]